MKKSTLISRSLGLLFFAISLCACQQTTFVHNPLDAKACADGLAGAFRLQEDGKPDDVYMVVNDHCHIQYMDNSNGKGWKHQAFTVQFDQIERRHYLVIDASSSAKLSESEDEKGINLDGFVVMRVKPSKKLLRIYDVDHREIAARIVREEIKGTVQKTESALINIITEDKPNTRQLLNQRGIFKRNSPVILKRIDASEIPAPAKALLTISGATP